MLQSESTPYSQSPLESGEREGDGQSNGDPRQGSSARPAHAPKERLWSLEGEANSQAKAWMYVVALNVGKTRQNKTKQEA